MITDDAVQSLSDEQLIDELSRLWERRIGSHGWPRGCTSQDDCHRLVLLRREAVERGLRPRLDGIGLFGTPSRRPAGRFSKVL